MRCTDLTRRPIKDNNLGVNLAKYKVAMFWCSRVRSDHLTKHYKNIQYFCKWHPRSSMMTKNTFNGIAFWSNTTCYIQYCILCQISWADAKIKVMVHFLNMARTMIHPEYQVLMEGTGNSIRGKMSKTHANWCVAINIVSTLFMIRSVHKLLFCELILNMNENGSLSPWLFLFYCKMTLTVKKLTKTIFELLLTPIYNLLSRARDAGSPVKPAAAAPTRHGPWTL